MSSRHLDPSVAAVGAAAAGTIFYDEGVIKSIRHSHNENVFAFDSQLHNRSWLQTIIDSSHLITFGISILVIIYGSFRSLNMDRKSNSSGEMSTSDKETLLSSSCEKIDLLDEASSGDDDSTNDSNSSVQTIDSIQALFIPVVASISLLFMFFFFDSIQTAFVLCTSVLANIAFYYLLCPVFHSMLKSICSNKSDLTNIKIYLCLIGSYTIAELLALLSSSTLVIMWILTGHWLLMNIIGIGFCITFIAIVRLPSLKVSTLLLVGLVVYDVIWVYFSHLIFSSNVMVKVATKEADNPVAILARKLNIEYRDSPKLSLPGKLVVPSYQNSGNFSILGLGDIVVPGLLLCFVLRFDAYKRSQMLSASQSNPEFNKETSSSTNKEETDYYFEEESKNDGGKKRSASIRFCSSVSSFFTRGRRRKTPTTLSLDDDQYFYSLRSLIKLNRISYFHCSLIGYFVGLITATLSSEIFREAQPALLFLVPFTLLPLLIMAYIKGDLRLMWNEPFNSKSSSYFYV